VCDLEKFSGLGVSVECPTHVFVFAESQLTSHPSTPIRLVSMDGILREFEKLEKKQINRPLISSVDQITLLLEDAKRKIQNGLKNLDSRRPLTMCRSSEHSFTFGFTQSEVYFWNIEDPRISKGFT
jgi:hypothetical protein